MRRHSRASGQPARSRRRKSPKSKGGNAPRVASTQPSRGGAETEVGQLRRELHEAREQQTATSEVLSVISGSPVELDPVFRAILQNAARICEAKFGVLNLYEDGRFRTVALHNPPPQFAIRLGRVIRPHPASGLAHVARTRQIAHIDDIRTAKPYLEGEDAVVELADIAGAPHVFSDIARGVSSFRKLVCENVELVNLRRFGKQITGLRFFR
jgi:hypothetical protein